MLTVVVLFMLAAFVLAWRQRKRKALACAVLAVALFLSIGYGPLAECLLEGLQKPYAQVPDIDWKSSNAIVVLGAGIEAVPGSTQIGPGVFAKGRILQGAMRYRACRAAGVRCTLILSGGDPKKHGATEAAVYRDYLLDLGVDAADIVIESQSLNTWQNAQFASEILARIKPDQVLLISSATHLRRAQRYFSHFGIHAIPVRGDYLTVVWSPLPQSFNFLLADIALHEYAGIARYDVYQYLGWNIRADHAGSI